MSSAVRETIGTFTKEEVQGQNQRAWNKYTNNQNIADLYRDIYEFKEICQINQCGINVVDLTNGFAMQNFDVFI
jgi:hypothetical protein